MDSNDDVAALVRRLIELLRQALPGTRPAIGAAASRRLRERLLHELKVTLSEALDGGDGEDAGGL